MIEREIKNIIVKDKLVLSITYTGRYEDCGKYIGKVFKAAGSQTLGKPFCIYHDKEFKEDNAVIEVCLEVKKELEKEGVICKTLKGGQALSLIHQGPYDTISDSYKFMADYIT